MTQPSLFFTNPGALDLRGLTTFGLNAKTSPSAFGRFGTGLKYAIAGILRLGGQICLHIHRSGETQVLYFDKASHTIRGKEFEFIIMHGAFGPGEAQLPFTTALGSHWEPWMLYRELRANAQDEGGRVSQTLAIPEGDYTILQVQCPELLQAHESRASFWLESEPLGSWGGVDFHPDRHPHAYCQRIKAGLHGSWAFGYSFTEAQLSEDRTFSQEGALRILLAKAILQCSDPAILSVIFDDEGSEKDLDYDWWDCRPGEAFCQVVLQRWSEKLPLPAGVWSLVKSLRPKEAQALELAVFPLTWEEAEANAPEPWKAKEYVSIWIAVSNYEDEIKGLRAERDFWKGVARRALAPAEEEDPFAALAPVEELEPEAVPDDEMFF